MVTKTASKDGQQIPVLNPMFVPPNIALGDNTELFCSIKRGKLPISFKWLHNGKEVTSKIKFKVTNTETSSHLSIGEIQASDIGNYSCVASNVFGQDTGIISLIIEVLCEDEAPVLNPMFLPPNIAIGDMTELSCTAKRGSLPISFSWLHNHKPISIYQKFKTSNSEISSQLRIGKISASDIGNYTCEATNAYGKDSTTLSVMIEGQMFNPYLNKTFLLYLFLPDVQYRLLVNPFFVLLWVVASCSAVSVKEESPILNPVFIPQNLALGDMTELTCTIKKGEISDSEPVLRPIIVPANLALGDITEISCTIKKGSLPVMFKWFHNGKQIQSHSKYRMSNTESSSHIYIGKIQATDIGNFTCVAENSFGQDQKTENVVIEGSTKEELPVLNAMFIPPNLALGDMTELSCIVKKGSEISNSEPVLRPMIVPANLALGDITELSCTIKKGSLPVKFKWFHNGKQIQSHSKYRISNIESSSHIYIGEIQATDIGNFTCVAENSFGEDQKTENVVIEALCEEEPPVLNPMFIPPNLAIGDMTEMTCTIKRGSLPISFTWLHDYKPISLHQKYKISKTDISSLLRIGKIEASDIGNYTCEALNIYGKDSKSQSVVIEVSAKEEAPFLNPMVIPPNLALGDMAELSCTIKRGSLPIKFEWFHNYNKVSENQNYKISSSKIGSQFLIEEIKAVDIGNYTCKASNLFGEDQKNEAVMIEEGKTAESEPVLRPMFVPVNLAIGDITELSCTIKKGSLPVSFKWFHNGEEIFSHSKYKISNTGSSSLIYVGEIQASDIGNFTCLVENSFGQDKKTETVVIEGFTLNEPPLLNPLLTPPNLAIGDITEFFCSVKRGSLPINFRWYHNGIEVESHHKYKISNSKSSSHFSVGEIAASDNGNYTCSASNDFGMDSKTQIILIEGFCNEVPVLNPLLVPPNLSIGDITEISCSIRRGSVPVRFKWLKDNVEVSASSKYKITDSGSGSHLKIGKIQPTDNGNYTCSVTNAYGVDEKVISLLIEVKGNEEIPVLNPMIVPPNLAIGDMAELSCTVKRGSLPIQFQWLHNNELIKQHEKYKVSSSQIGSHFLIGKIKPSDIGNYTCKAENTYGEDSKTQSVIIEAFTKEESPILNPMFIPPNLALGDMTELSCTVKRGSLPITFDWYHNYNLVNDHQKYKVTKSQTGSMFRIGEVTASDNGNYTCKARNLYGEDSKTGSVLIEGYASEEAPILSPLLIPPNLAIGDTTEFLCTVRRGSQPISFSWMHNGYEIEKHYKYKTSNGKTSSQLSIGKIQASDIGNYSCVATNRFGQDTMTGSLIIDGLTLEDAPILNALLIPPNLAVGDMTDIMCTVKRGSLPLEFKWLHNGKDMLSHSKYKITSMGSASHLSLSKIGATDIGNYTCIVKNSFGQDKNTVNVVLDGCASSDDAPVLSPLFIPPNLEIGDKTELSCTVKRGSEPISFSWLHNKIPIESHKKYKIFDRKSSSQLSVGQIQPSDVGNFTCIAMNRFGQDSITGNLIIEGNCKDVTESQKGKLCLAISMVIRRHLHEECVVDTPIFQEDHSKVHRAGRICDWSYEHSISSRLECKVTCVQPHLKFVGRVGTTGKTPKSTSSLFGGFGRSHPQRVAYIGFDRKLLTAICINMFQVKLQLLLLTLVFFIIHKGNMADDAPILNDLLIPTNIALGDITDIICTVKRGSLPMEFKWLHNGIEITNSLKYKITTIGSTSHLSLGKIDASDIGNYTCIVKNSFGHDKNIVKVILEGSDMNQESPILYPLMIPLNPTLGDEADIMCKLRRGSVPVEFQWFKNGKEISSNQKLKVYMKSAVEG
nr:titin-like [Parasteatoda tepidariorum]